MIRRWGVLWIMHYYVMVRIIVGENRRGSDLDNDEAAFILHLDSLHLLAIVVVALFFLIEIFCLFCGLMLFSYPLLSSSFATAIG
ncbi:hypothetical protein KFK09_016624 [Dendrobium nobile]|uniref:Transmembrane protein n=1 Tax=Dendrobium nobile TaxID=94219 RepID=A0A8T3AZ64_DENNO|nr:hypothetical protein KFK09_016624 [Dendrobium nobile]